MFLAEPSDTRQRVKLQLAAKKRPLKQSTCRVQLPKGNQFQYTSITLGSNQLPSPIRRRLWLHTKAKDIGTKKHMQVIIQQTFFVAMNELKQPFAVPPTNIKRKTKKKREGTWKISFLVPSACHVSGRKELGIWYLAQSNFLGGACWSRGARAVAMDIIFRINQNVRGLFLSRPADSCYFVFSTVVFILTYNTIKGKTDNTIVSP